MSPEQVEAKDVDQRSDIYSLGVILYEMVSGRVPFEGDTPFSIGVKHKSEEPEDPIKYNSRIPEDLSRVILKCLEKDKERRYQNSGNVCSELTGIEEGIPISEIELPRQKPSTSRDITVSFQRRWLLIAIPLIALLSFTLFFILKNGKEVIFQETKMLVVLPFDNQGPPEDEYFANGITDDIRNRLSVIPKLVLISSTSAIQYKKTEKSIQQIREESGVDYVVTGTVRWDKGEGERGRVLVSPQLIRASDDTQIWSEDYKEPIEDIFGVQAKISAAIVRQLDFTLLEPERKLMEAKPTDNLNAYDFYLRGKEHKDTIWSSLEYQKAELAVEMYEKAIELDSGFIDAYTALSYLHSASYFFGIDRSEARLKKARLAVDKALEIRPDYPEANLCLAYYYFWGFLDHERALEIYESVQKVRPNVSLELKGSIHAAQGRFEEALESLENTFKLDPRSYDLSRDIGYIYENMRRYAEAEVWFDRSLSLSPKNLTTLGMKLLNSIFWKGNSQDARAILDTFPPGPVADMLLTDIELSDRRYEEALSSLDHWSLDSFGIGMYFIHKDLYYAAVYLGLEKLSLAYSHADSARIALENFVQIYPNDPKYHLALGRAYAYLGRKGDAVHEGNQAVKLYPISKNALYGTSVVNELTKILIMVREYDTALDKLEYLMSIHAGASTSINGLKYHPRFDPLRDHPRFKRLLEKYSNEDETQSY
jgi:serine/threonine-protein kinase